MKDFHETDYQRARRQRSEVRKHGVTGSTPEDAAKRIKSHAHAKALAAKKGEKYAMSAKELYGYSPVKRDRAHKKRLGLP